MRRLDMRSSTRLDELTRVLAQSSVDHREAIIGTQHHDVCTCPSEQRDSIGERLRLNSSATRSKRGQASAADHDATQRSKHLTAGRAHVAVVVVVIVGTPSGGAGGWLGCSRVAPSDFSKAAVSL